MNKHIVESPYYSKSFDGAIFDGPFRIYFAQYQEQVGLELYHYLSKNMSSLTNQVRTLNKKFKRNIYIFTYTSDENKKKYQPKNHQGRIFLVPFQSHYILGLSQQDFMKNKLCLQSYLEFIRENWSLSQSLLEKNSYLPTI